MTDEANPSVAPVTETVMYETIQFEIVAHVARITLNRPERLNAFNQTMSGEIAQAWGRVRDDADIHVAVLRAAGDRAFCTGIDIKEGLWWGDTGVWDQVDPGQALGPRHHRVWKPVVAAINGMCSGGAHYFINQCDILICSDDAQFFDPHANIGVVSALEPIGLLHRGVPLGEVLRWALMGSEERVGAETAQRWGLVSEIVPRADLWARADAIAATIALRRPKAIQGTIKAIWEALELSPTAALNNGFTYTHFGLMWDKGEEIRRFDTGEGPSMR